MKHSAQLPQTAAMEASAAYQRSMDERRAPTVFPRSAAQPNYAPLILRTLAPGVGELEPIAGIDSLEVCTVDASGRSNHVDGIHAVDLIDSNGTRYRLSIQPVPEPSPGREEPKTEDGFLSPLRGDGELKAGVSELIL